MSLREKKYVEGRFSIGKNLISNRLPLKGSVWFAVTTHIPPEIIIVIIGTQGPLMDPTVAMAPPKGGPNNVDRIVPIKTMF